MMAVLRNHQSELFADRRCEFDGIGVLEVPRAYEGHRRFTMVDGFLPHPVLNSLHAVQRVKQIPRREVNGRVLHGSVSKDRGGVINGFSEEEISERHLRLAAQFDELIHRRCSVAGHSAVDTAMILGGKLAGRPNGRHPFPDGSGHGYLRGSTHGASLLVISMVVF